MPLVSQVVAAAGSAVLAVVEPGGPDVTVTDVFVVAPEDPTVGYPGDLVVGLVARADAADLVERCAEARSAALVLRRTIAADPEVRRVAVERGLPLLGLADDVSWSHAVGLLRDTVDRLGDAGGPAVDDSGGHGDLFALADAAAAVAGAPVTIEDADSRVVAYSSGQDLADAARVSTIVGRRVPPDVLAHFRARGVFRRMARSAEPFLVEDVPAGTLPRFVVPVRAGQEWLGSIWVIAKDPVSPAVVADLRAAAASVAVHLLRLRSHRDVARVHTRERVRALLADPVGDRRELPDLPAGPFRVVVLEMASEPEAATAHVDLWLPLLRRSGWAEPLLADLDGRLFAVVAATGRRAGSWEWLRDVVATLQQADATVRVAAGAPAGATELSRSRAEAVETLALTGAAAVGPVAYDEAWAPLTVRRAVAQLKADDRASPVAVLHRHDLAHGTAYVASLRAWLRHPTDPRGAAAELGVHVNTLRHRLRRIGELVEIDTTDPDTRLAVWLAAEALRAGPADSTPPDPLTSAR